MKLEKDKWSIDAILRKRKTINTKPDYQRPEVWTTPQKQSLIDSILKGYDIPKIYLNPNTKSNYKHDVIDGQQRFTTIWHFLDNEFRLAADAEKVNGIDVANKKYEELDEKIKDIIGKYELDIVSVTDCSEDEIWEMFLRLQKGTPLNAQEKRNAIRGEMRDFVKQVSSHMFFEKVNFKDSRYTYDLVSAQMTLLSLSGKICNVKDKDLTKMYKENKKFNSESTEAKNIFKILNYLDRMFKDKSPELTRYSVVSLFVLLMDMMPNYVLKGREKDLYEWFVTFETNRNLDKKIDIEKQNPTLIVYQDRISQGSDNAESLEFRNKVLKEDLLSNVKNLPLKDTIRDFDAAQRQVIYRRDKGICQICGKPCEWNEWHADHKLAWNRGGRTCIENGQVLCRNCNEKKHDKVI